jgi:D-alanyl-lipoteichoic acid acyltransferase DltB (MBOAT superfamily)
MFFNSFVFLLFLALVLPVYYLLPRQRGRAIWLLAASYVFYGYWDWRFCSLLLLSTVVDFLVGRAMHAAQDPRRRKHLLVVSCVVNLGILGFFKYAGFFVDSIQATAASLGMSVDFLHLNIILPVGISFYTFQTMSYTIDIYRRRLEPTGSLVDFALFVSFFPQLVAGPIERARNLLPQIAVLRRPDRRQVSEGLALLTVGYFKKVLIGDSAGRIVDNIFGQPDLYRSPELLAGLVLFSIQIYADFSGYSNIARGLAKLLGLELMKNFEQPYLAANITEFWRRWHISLSSWLRDYLYISLGGNRRGHARTYVNLMLTMLLGGLWHGAAWTFVVWGGLHGLYLAVHKMFLGDRKVADHFEWRGPRSLVGWLAGVVTTNLLVLLTWLFFRAEDFGQAWYFLSNFVHWQGSELTPRFVGITVSFVGMVVLLDALEYFSGSHAWLLRLRPAVAAGVGTAVMVVVLLYMATTRPMPFVYFQF